MDLPKIKLRSLEVSDKTYDIYQCLCVLAQLYNHILIQMDMTFITTENRNYMERAKKYIEKLYHTYSERLKNEGLDKTRVYVENLETKQMYMISLDDPMEIKGFIKYYPEEANQTKKFYHKKLSYPALDKNGKSFCGIFTIHGKISIPKQFRKECIGARSGELLFFLDTDKIKNVRIQILNNLINQMIQLNNMTKSLSLNFEITDLIELIDLERGYILKYAPSNSGVMYIKTRDAVFELYSSEVKLNEKPLEGHIRMVDRDGQLFSSIQNDSLRNLFVFRKPERVMEDVKSMKKLVKNKEILPVQLSTKK